MNEKNFYKSLAVSSKQVLSFNDRLQNLFSLFSQKTLTAKTPLKAFSGDINKSLPKNLPMNLSFLDDAISDYAFECFKACFFLQ